MIRQLTSEICNGDTAMTKPPWPSRRKIDSFTALRSNAVTFARQAMYTEE